MSAQRSGVRSLRVSTVLQACADQLAVLAHIIPDSYKSPPGGDTVCKWVDVTELLFFIVVAIHKNAQGTEIGFAAL